MGWHQVDLETAGDQIPKPIVGKCGGTASREAYWIIAQFFDFSQKLSASSGSPPLQAFRLSSLTDFLPDPPFIRRIKRAATGDGLSLVTLAMGMVIVGTGTLDCLERLHIAHGMYSQLT